MANSKSSSQDTATSQNKGIENEVIDTIMKDSALHRFFVKSLKDIYYAESAIVENLPTFQKACTTEELREAFEDDEYQSKKHIARLEKVFMLLGEKAEKIECEAIKGLIKESEEIINSTPVDTMTRDAALIIAAQKIEHYEIATYGGLIQLAITMRHYKAAILLEKTLQDEENTDYYLTEIAESHINFEAEEEI